MAFSGPSKDVDVGPILERALNLKKAVYLVSLKLYPGKVEFNYLPENTQGIICQPMGNKGVLILGANAPRSYTKQDETWVEGIADKLGASLGCSCHIPGDDLGQTSAQGLVF